MDQREWVIAFLALEHGPCSVERIRTLFRRLKHTNPRHRHIKEKTITLLLKQLQREGHTQKRGEEWALHPEKKHAAARQMLVYGELQRNLRIWGLRRAQAQESYDKEVNLIRITFFLLTLSASLDQHVKTLPELIARCEARFPDEVKACPPLERLFSFPGFAASFEALPRTLQTKLFSPELHAALFHFKPLSPYALAFVQALDSSEELDHDVRYALDLQELLGLREGPLTHFLESGSEAALKAYKASRPNKRIPQGYLYEEDLGLSAIAMVLSRLERGRESDRGWVERRLHDYWRSPWAKIFESLYLLVKPWIHPETEASTWAAKLPQAQHPLGRLFHALFSHWLAPSAQDLKRFTSLLDQTRDANLPLLTRLLEAMIAKCKGEPSTCFVATMELFAPQWRRQLEALEELTVTKQQSQRLVWLISPRQGLLTDVEIRLQKKGPRGWNKGKRLNPDKSNQWSQALSLSAQDRLALTCRVEDWYTKWEIPRLLNALVGHPLLFDFDEPENQLTLHLKKPLFRLRQVKGGQRLQSEANLTLGYLLERNGNHLSFTHLTGDAQALTNKLGEEGIFIPTEGIEALDDIIDRLPREIHILSDTRIRAGAYPKDPYDPRIHLLLKPASKHCLQFSSGALPHPDAPLLSPGEGEPLIVRHDPARGLTLIERDLEAEARHWSAFQLALGPLIERLHFKRLTTHDLRESLDLLHALQSAKQHVLVKWPKGKSLQLRQSLDLQNLEIQQSRGWLEVGANIEVDEGKALNLKALLKAYRGAKLSGYIELDEGRFARLSARLQRALDHLEALGAPIKEKRKLHPLLALSLEEGALPWSDALKKKRHTLSKVMASRPTIPARFNGELRPYQREGFRWLARLSELGFGACLADEMGLGKTIQALALALRHASKGPTLVVAPTSVCGNWIKEASHFTPTLSLKLLYKAKDRARMIQETEKGHLLVCSYGLLVSEVELLKKKRWALVILDEGHAIKNASTQRSKAASRLKSKARVATTGTPIENRPEELWSLFRFLNPGLLGSEASFRRDFASPISKGDKRAIANLKARVAPFLLRRQKNEVLETIPERQVLDLEILLSDQERALYEATRRHAIEELARTNDQGQTQRVRILAQLMKLRRLTCDPALIDHPLPLMGSKRAALIDLMSELKEEGHRALIFSQFVDMLQLVRADLEGMGLELQYLDGATPQAKRDLAVAAFQGGQGDAFLISLRAGGVGLNLTAADRVIHLDPWWNPAVEDQASDRAHRIGQERDVLIYRLFAKDTIEEKILDLHQEKRALTDTLLEGSATATSLDLDALMAMLT